MEGPMNVEPEFAAETEPEAAGEAQAPSPASVFDIPAGRTAHFPTPEPRLTAQAAATLAKLRGH
jgi:hypothetical protein